MTPPRTSPPSLAVARRDLEPAAAARRFSPETIDEAVRALESGVPAPVVCRRFGVSDRTLYRWRRRAGDAVR